MRKFYLLLFAIVSCVSLAEAQIAGTVLDEKDSRPLGGVNIYLQRDSIGIGITDGAGKFEIAHVGKYGEKDTVVGGKYFSTNRRLEYTEARVEVYDMEKDTVYVDKVNPHQVANPITFIYDDCLYVMGGTVKKNLFSDKVHLLDLKTGVWYDAGITIPKERRGNTRGILIEDVVYFLAGRAKPLCGR